MLLQTDTLLTKKFFSSLESSPELQTAFQTEENELSTLIKTELYPLDEKAIYYEGKYFDSRELSAFINSKNYQPLQDQLATVIGRLKQWGEQHTLQGGNSLDDFLIKLKQPTEKISLLYADGKRSLEIITVLLEDGKIPLELRKTVYTQLLADNELSKCIDGCYTRISTSRRQLESYRKSPNQINRWIQDYTTNVARKIAAQRPFAMPESYQVLVCRTLEISATTNELHASNYLLLQAKENQFPINNINDIGALEIKHKMHTKYDKLAELYLEDLAAAITASELVNYIAIRLHEDVNQIISDSTHDYIEKITAIENNLNLIGLDSDFLLEEILESEPFKLKTVNHLKITIERRLSQQKWLKPIQPNELNISMKIYIYYNFPNNIELSFFSKKEDSKRYAFFDLIQDLNMENFSADLKFQILMSLLRKPNYINSTKSLNRILNVSHFSSLLAAVIPDEIFINILKKEDSVVEFVDCLSRLDGEKGLRIIQKLGKQYISNIIFEGHSKANVKRIFYWLEATYFLQHYNKIAKNDGLKITQQLFQQIIKKGYRDFEKYIFYRSDYLDYLNQIDFSHCQLTHAFFFQQVNGCKFDHAILKDAVIDARIIFSSFKGVDLRQTRFIPSISHNNLGLDLSEAQLSTESFKQLMGSGINNFQAADLTEVDLQEILAKKSWYLDFSGANLKNRPLNGIDFNNIKLFDSNLQNTNLMSSIFNPDNLNTHISIQGATLDKLAVSLFFNAGVRQFDDCKIIEVDILPSVVIKFVDTRFKNTQFIGYIYDIEFQSCDLSGSQFKSDSHFPLTKGPAFISNVKFKNCQLKKSTFKHIKFIEPFKLQESLLKSVALEEVEMSTSMMFKFYSMGQRDFSGISQLKGKIPDKLPPMPLLEAKLSREAFIQLVKLGLTDFRMSNLQGFYLGKILEEEAKSEINLKLEGADYQQSTLSCASSRSNSPHHSSKRSIQNCNVYFLLQKSQAKKTISWQDLLDLDIINTNENTILKESNLPAIPLYLLDKPNNLYFFWGYEPDSEALLELPDFLQKSTYAAQRNQINTYIYFKHIKIDTLQTLAQAIRQLGFTHGQFTYFNEKNQCMMLDLTKKSPTQINQTSKLTLLIDKMKPSITPSLANKNKLWHTNLKNTIKELKNSAIQDGLKYEIFLVLLDIIATWLDQVNAPDVKKLDVTTKLDLQEFAEQLVKQEAPNFLANERLSENVFTIALQCIDRGECSTRELVRENIMNTYQNARPLTDVGFAEMGQRLKNLFNSTGAYFKDKADDFGRRLSLLSLIIASHNKAIGTTETNNNKSKRILTHWYHLPQLIYFIRVIESAFQELDYDLNLDPSYSEALLAGYLYDFGLALKKQGITLTTPLNQTLNLLQNKRFIQSTYDGSYISNNTLYLKTNQTGTRLTKLSKSSPLNRQANHTQPYRNKRTTLFYQKESEIDQFADHYLTRYTHQQEKIKPKTKREKTNKPINRESQSQQSLTLKKRENTPKQTIKKGHTNRILRIQNTTKPSVIPRKKNNDNRSLVKLFPYTKPNNEFFSANHKLLKQASINHPTSTIITSPLATTKGLLTGKKEATLAINLQGHTPFTSKQVVPHCTAQGMLFILNMCFKKSNKPKPVASFKKIANYQKAVRSIEREKQSISFR